MSDLNLPHIVIFFEGVCNFFLSKSLIEAIKATKIYKYLEVRESPETNPSTNRHPKSIKTILLSKLVIRALYAVKKEYA